MVSIDKATSIKERKETRIKIMVKLLKQSKNMITYAKHAKNLYYISIKNNITRFNVRHISWVLLRKGFENKLNE